MAMFVNGRRVITNAPGAVVRSTSENYTDMRRKKSADYENLCKSEDLVDCCEDVMVDGHAVATIKSFFPQSTGDEGGMGGGVKSGTVNGKGVFTTASPDVFVSSLDGSIVNEPIVREGDLVISNNGNCEPAAIEYLPGHQIENPCQTPELKVKEDSAPASLTLVVHGRNQAFQGHFVAHCQLSKTYEKAVLATFEEPSDVKGLAKRLTFRGIRHTDFSFGFYQNAIMGKRIAISFLERQQASELNEEPTRPMADELTQIVLFRPVMNYQLPKKQLINANNADFSDIFRLGDKLRARVYHSLMLQQLTVEAALFDDEDKNTIALDPIHWANDAKSMMRLASLDKNWYQLLPDALRKSVDDELSSKIIGSLPNGYIYVYLDGHLWREIHCRDGNMHEVDLRRSGGYQSRSVIGLEQTDLMLPYKVVGQSVKVEIAFSDEQWSWGRVRYYGGMAKDDIRRINDIDPLVKDTKRAEQHRAKRFIELDLKSLIDDKQKEVLDASNGIQLFEDFGIYHCVIPSPLTPIKRAIQDIFSLQTELISVAENSQHPVHCAHGSTAALTYKYFFDEKSGLLAKQKTNKDIKKANEARSALRTEQLMSYRWDKAAKAQDSENDDIRRSIDLDKIKATLKVDRRQRLRDLIRGVQRSLVSLIQRTDTSEVLVNTQPALISECSIDWQMCLKDGFAGNIEPYAKAFNLIGNISNALSFEPSDIDVDMDLKRDIDKTKATPGSRYIVSLNEASHPLHDLIHPNEEALIKAQKLPDVKTDQPFSKSFNDYKNTGEDFFNIHFFKFITQGGVGISKNVFDLFNAVIKDMASAHQISLNKELSNINAHADAIKSVYKHLDNYLQITANKHMPKTELKLLSDMHDDDVIIGMGHAQLFTKRQTKGMINEVAKETKHPKKYYDHVNVSQVKAKKTQRVAITLHKDLSHLQGKEINEVMNFFGEQRRAEHLLSQTLAEQRQSLNVVGNTQKSLHDHLVVVCNAKDYEQTSIFKRKPYHMMDIGSSSVLLLFGIWNVKLKLEARSKFKEEEGEGSSEKTLELLDASISASYLIENVGRSLSDMKHVEKWYEAQSELIEEAMEWGAEQGFSFTPLSVLATLGSSIAIGLSLKSLFMDFKEHSPQFVIPHLAKLGINMGVTLSFIGSAAERALADKVSEKLAMYAAEKLYVNVSEAALKKLALNEVLEATTYGFARKSLIRLAIPFSSSYVGMFLMVAGFAIEAIIEANSDSELMTWVKSTSFFLDRTKNEAKDEGDLMAEFANTMTRPSALIGKTNPCEGPIKYFIDFTLPMFDPEHHQLQLSIYTQEIEMVFGQQFDNLASALATNIKYKKAMFQPAYGQECVFNKNLQLTKVRIHLSPDTNWLQKVGTEVKLSCQFRILLNDGISLPLEKYHGRYLHQHQLRGADEAHAYHAEPLYIIGKGKEQLPSHCQEGKTLPEYLKNHSKKVKVVAEGFY